MALEHLTKQTFLDKVFNYEVNKEWKFEGELPAIIDFFADWCGPCKMVAPILEELSAEYAGKINIYKIDTEAEQELAAAFNIRSIPSMLFIPMNGQPQMAVGALPKDALKNAISEVLLQKTELTRTFFASCHSCNLVIQSRDGMNALTKRKNEYFTLNRIPSSGILYLRMPAFGTGID